MNIFRLVADLLHLASILLLLLKIRKTRSASGISLKTQSLYVLVFVSRYLDLFTHFVSFYNSLMKIAYISSSIYIVYFIYTKIPATWDPRQDIVKVELLIVPSLILAIFINYGRGWFDILEILWAFSIYLESVAIVPQLFMLQRTGEAAAITTHYIFCLGAYRGLYIFNWIYKYFAHQRVEYIPVICGIVQTAIYSDFFYIYFTQTLKGKKFQLPA